MTRLRLLWRHGDWRLEAPPGGTWARTSTAITSLAGVHDPARRKVTPMSCNPLLHPSCITPRLISPAGSDLTSGFLNGLAKAVAKAVHWSLTDAATLWIHIPSPNLAAAPVTDIQGWLLPITAAVAVGAMIAAGVRMILTRRANPLLDISGGLLTLTTAIVLGVVVPELLLQAGDAWSAWILRISTGGHFTQRITELLDFSHQTVSIVIIFFGLAAVIVALIQAVLILFRQIALVVLAGVLPLAAAGSMAPLTRPWIRKISSWMLALIFYKPAAAAVYATAFTLIGSGRSTACWGSSCWCCRCWRSRP